MRTVYIELSRAGIRATSSRIAVLTLFRENPAEHFSAEQVYRKLTASSEPCSLASVYRTLTHLMGAGLIVSATVGESRVVYELNRGEPHYHLVCDSCGSIRDVHDEALEAAYRSIATANLSAYHRASVVVFGECSDCQARRRIR